MNLKFSLAFAAMLCASAQAALYEAEDQPGIDAASITAGAEFSGGKYVAVSKAMTFNIEVKETAVYDIETQVRIKQYDWTTSKILVNGVEAGSMLTTPRNCDSNYVIKASAKMRIGKNTVTVGNEAIGVDYIQVEKHPDPVFDIDPKPVTPGASAETYKVKKFLVDNFGKKTLSGMMISEQVFNYDYTNDSLGCGLDSLGKVFCERDLDSAKWNGQPDIAGFRDRAGDYPAIIGFDMLFAAGGHSDEGWFKGYSQNNLVMAEEFWKNNGIPTFTWHWKVGKDTVFYTQNEGFKNKGCEEGVQGTAANNTCFNYTKAFTDSTCKEIDSKSETYQLIIEDVDKISKLFKVLQNKNVPVLWRPLHEASGGWFWWRVASGNCYKALYRLVYDRMVNVNKLNNLLWVWNINTDPKYGYDYSALNAEWYPGDDVVDVVGVDIYDPLLNHNSGANYFNKIVEDVGSHKLIALTENGAIPDIDSIAEDKATWSYWMTWSQTWSGNFLDKTPTEMWKKNIDNENVLSLRDMPNWKEYSASIRSANKKSSEIQIAQMGKELQITLPVHSSATLFSMTGKQVLHIGSNLPAGTHAINISKLPQGAYIIRVKNASDIQTQKILLK